MKRVVKVSKWSISCLAMILLLAGCGSQVAIDSDYKAGFDFTQLRSYQWHGSSKNHANDILDGRIRNSVDEVLGSQGYQLEKGAQVDFLVNYGVTTEEKTDIRTYNTYSGMAPGYSMGYRRGYYRYGYSMAYRSEPEVVSYQYEEGTLIIDVVDAKTDKLVWRGTAEGRLKDNMSVEERQQATKAIVAKVLEGFPPEA